MNLFSFFGRLALCLVRFRQVGALREHTRRDVTFDVTCEEQEREKKGTKNVVQADETKANKGKGEGKQGTDKAQAKAMQMLSIGVSDSVRLARNVAHECGPAARVTPTKCLTQKQRQAAARRGAAQSRTTRRKTKRAAQRGSRQTGSAAQVGSREQQQYWCTVRERERYRVRDSRL